MTNIVLDTDSYKLSHHLMRPPSRAMSAYFTARRGLEPDDDRIVFFGMRGMYESLLTQRVTFEMIEEADDYFGTHMAGGKPFPWPKKLFERIVRENDGWIPLTVRALRDGEVVYPGTPMFEITAHEPYEGLVTWWETALVRIWSPLTTATKSAHVREDLRRRFEESAEPEEMWRLNYALHDFGARGVSSAETAMWTGMGHLLVFDGTDTCIAGAKATDWNMGPGVGQSVHATEHSVMTAWISEKEALSHLLDVIEAGSILSVVADSYDYDAFLGLLPQFAPRFREKNIRLVVRPDSGDPVECVTSGLLALEKAFGVCTNAKGYKVIRGAGIIQGDGLDTQKIREISEQVELLGYSAQNVVYGMGGGLLQKQTRDTLSCAMKLCSRTDPSGLVVDCKKKPVGDLWKRSIPGRTRVFLTGDPAVPTVFPFNCTWEDRVTGEDMLEVIWDGGPTDYVWETFDQMRGRFRHGWAGRPPRANSFSDQLRKKMF